VRLCAFPLLVTWNRQGGNRDPEYALSGSVPPELYDPVVEVKAQVPDGSHVRSETRHSVAEPIGRPVSWALATFSRPVQR
jgi:hypothetical protein